MTQQIESVNIGGVDVLRWNPHKPLPLRPQRFFRWTKKLPFSPRVNNVGDMAGVDVARHLHREMAGGARAPKRGQLGAIGSIMHMLPQGTTVWGPGVNGKHLDLELPRDLDIRAVRGPRTRQYLMERGYRVPEIFGDPGLLLPQITGAEKLAPNREVTIIANLNDVRFENDPRTLSALVSLKDFTDGIRRSEFIVASSLHGIIFADAYGIPVCPLVTEAEPLFKYLDYFEGTGRSQVKFAHTVEEALDLGPVPQLEWDPRPLIEAFPSDLWLGNQRR
ncbi:polysaccharide pyruvyl transferase family protein [Dermabacteraceae bacterium P13115]|nr:polysaccharide pyruvyl transferase family protein [Dermabacteraceae bacterium TAE3-ERU5]